MKVQMTCPPRQQYVLLWNLFPTNHLNGKEIIIYLKADCHNGFPQGFEGVKIPYLMII